MATEILGSYKGNLIPLQVDESGNLIVSATDVLTIHHEDDSEVEEGKEADVNGLRELALSITGDAKTHRISFWASVDGVIWTRTTGECVIQDEGLVDDYNLHIGHGYVDNYQSTQLYLNSEKCSQLWYFKISGLKKFKTVIEEISGGSLTVVSNAIY